MRTNRFLPALFLLFLWAGGAAAQERGGRPVDLSHLAGADYSRFLQDRGGPLPASYDLRTEGRVTSVKDVGPYNTDWAFAAMGSAESSYLTQKLGGTPDLSAMHLAWFAYMEPDKSFPILGDWGGVMERPRSADVLAQGGSDLRATAVLARWTGLVSEDDLPYKTVPDKPAAGYANRVVLQDVFYLGGSENYNYRTNPRHLQA